VPTKLGTLGDRTVTAAKAADLLRTRGWLRNGAIAETMGGRQVGTTSSVVSGTLKLVGGVVLPAGRAVTAITFMSAGTAAVAPTNQWFCLVDKTLSVLATTVDDTNVAWGANAEKPLLLSASYTPPTDAEVYLGLCVVAGTPPSLQALTVPAATTALAPTLHASSSTGLTNPASLGATAGALTPLANVPWAYVS
jgi:hypothetical protein